MWHLIYFSPSAFSRSSQLFRKSSSAWSPRSPLSESVLSSSKQNQINLAKECLQKLVYFTSKDKMQPLEISEHESNTIPLRSQFCLFKPPDWLVAVGWIGEEEKETNSFLSLYKTLETLYSRIQSSQQPHDTYYRSYFTAEDTEAHKSGVT